MLIFTLKPLCLCLPPPTAHLNPACAPSLPVPPPPPSRPPSCISLVVLPCDRGEGSPGRALLGGHGVLLRQALLHLLLPDQDTQVDVLRRRPRQRGEMGLFFGGGVCMLQHEEDVLCSICCIFSRGWESSADRNRNCAVR